MGDDHQVLLHGILHVTVCEVDRVSGESHSLIFLKLIKSLGKCLGLGRGTFKLYTAVDIGNTRVCKTRLVETESCKTRWDESFHVYSAHPASHITFFIKEFNPFPFGPRVFGVACIPIDQNLLSGQVINEWLEISRQKHVAILQGSKIHVKIKFESIIRYPNWSKGIGSSNYSGVPSTFFPQVDGCKVSLYQDAHVSDDFTPDFHLPEGKHYRPYQCWKDIFDAISDAKHFIYIAGWSVYPHVTLIRDPRKKRCDGNQKTPLTLGELLKMKANQGVRVLMLVWDDPTSIKLLNRDGVMTTHDEDTGDYFRGSRVHCVLCPRDHDKGQSLVRDIECAMMFTHHQKIVIVDADNVPGINSQKRRIVSFIGGIDPCDGRYDTPTHSLFESLSSAHKNDFRQPNFSGASLDKGGPRQPWHDVHCRLEGPVAWDVLLNFEQRWGKQGGDGDLLLKLDDLGNVFISRSESGLCRDLETWKVQIFRSIDGGAASGLPNSVGEASERGLIIDRENVIDRSIQHAYINAIRRAKNFIYIENQYFIGSSFCWINLNDAEFKDVGAMNLIPKELSLKIANKIAAGERFAVYIVIPMWPEGIPESKSVQAILHWQKRTMEMMYCDVIKAISDKGIEADPLEYLSFFCLGNREVEKAGEYVPQEKPGDITNYRRAQENRRFMIYVHAKTMIVDDEYIIIGSANINQRSMDGSRDTEIAMGGYQPHHLAKENPARGQIYDFRMALWHEHIGEFLDCFNEPQSLECIRRVNEIADRNWGLYSSQTMDGDLPSHLLMYPIEISEDGEVVELPGVKFFPDTTAKVLGSKSLLLPPLLTT